jgi:hypothetical protein
LALGPQVIVVWQGVGYQVVAEGEAVPAVHVPDPVEPAPVDPSNPPVQPNPIDPQPPAGAPVTLPCALALLPLGMVVALGLSRKRGIWN